MQRQNKDNSANIMIFYSCLKLCFTREQIEIDSSISNLNECGKKRSGDNLIGIK